MSRHVGQQCPCLLAEAFAGAAQVQRLQGARGYLQGQFTAAGRHEAMAQQLQFDLCAHALQQWQPAVREKFERRCQRVVRAAAEVDAARCVGLQQGGQQRLQHQAAATGSADGETVIAAANRPRYEAQALRAKFDAAGVGRADLSGGIHCGQMLAQQARPAALGADVVDAKRLAGEHRQAQRAAQNLAATDGAVQFEEIRVHYSSLLLTGGHSLA